MMVPWLYSYMSPRERRIARHVRPVKSERVDYRSVDEWILSVVVGKNEETLDTLSRRVSNMNCAQVLLAIDRLSQNRYIALWPVKHGDDRIMPKGPV